ncbi:recombinase family protein [Faecalispora jeddahensis]|uniref:recombinase family protein n=1 Tax=Faecalispora jeddahensis TaxID=1414721 RepID=UPI00145AA85B|nr:recombinase family protein [Faecalispora jeddahensis]
MARIRKNSAPKDRVLWNAALYIRLSREDGNDESYSVKNQRQRLMEYLENRMLCEEMCLAGIYVDDGCTGTDSDRESFQRMLEEIDQGIVNCVIVKDLSRLSRNDWECKRYLQHLFVVKDVRFISLELPKLDSFENPDEVYEMGVSIQSMYNENHCRETSIKVRGTFNMKRGKGEFIGAFAPYGYSKDSNDRHRLLVDPPAADIVKDIFYWFVRDGMSKIGIAKRLIGMGIPCPAAYKRQNGMKYHNPAIKNKEPLWSARSITAILTNQMYLGHMVQGKQKVKSYKVHTRINIPENEWFIVEDTHEPIVDKETFDQAQMLMQKDTRTAPGAGRLYTFSGFLRCADCGKAMGRRTSKHLVYYACKTNLTQGQCTRHSIRDDVLERAVLETIQKQVVLIDNMAQLIDDIDNAPAPRDVSNRLAASLRLQKQELEKISGIRTGLYLDWKNGDITREEYRRMKKEFEEKEQRLRQDITRLEEENQGMPQDAPDPCFEAFRRDNNLSSLDRGMVIELIKAIHIYEGGDITIEFNFADPYKRIAELVQNSREE